MTGHDRYKSMTAAQCDKQTLMSYLCRVPANKNLIPVVESIENQHVLDVGLGSGYYTKLILDKNTVVGVDQNPHLCELPITVHQGDAGALTEVVGDEKFDVVLSTWMTDYLSPTKLQEFFHAARSVLKDNGKLIVTYPNTYGLGFIYVRMARYLRGVDKYTHRKKDVVAMLKEEGFTRFEIVNLNARLGLPWAFVTIAQ